MGALKELSCPQAAQAWGAIKTLYDRWKVYIRRGVKGLLVMPSLHGSREPLDPVYWLHGSEAEYCA